MANKNIQIKDVEGNALFPKTLGSIVLNNAGKNLGGVEENAQVNLIESVKLNGTALSITDKAVDIVLPAAAEYTITKLDTASEGAAATYQLAKDGVAFGTKIDIPKDMFVESGSVKTVTEADKPYEGAKVGDQYIDIVLANATDSHIYIPANSLVDVYTAADATIVIEGKTIKVDLTELGKTFQAKCSEAQQAALDSGVTSTKVSAYDTHVADADIHVTAEQKTAWSGKQDALTTAQLAAVNSGITAEKLATIEAMETGKVDANAAITAGTHTKITYDAKGLVTAGADLTADDIPSLNLTKIGDVTATAAEVNKLAGLATTATELGYVNGVTSSIQTQLDGKAAKATTLSGYGITDGLTYEVLS